MKKITGFIAILVLAILLTACGGDGDKATRTFELEHDGVKTTMKYRTKGDIVTMQTTENIIQYDLVGITSKEEAEELFAPMITGFDDIKGLEHKLEYDDTKAIETLAIDYETVNLDDIQHLPGMDFSDGDQDKGISMEKSLEILKEQGFTEVK